MQVIWCLKFCNIAKSGEGTKPPLQILGDLSPVPLWSTPMRIYTWRTNHNVSQIHKYHGVSARGRRRRHLTDYVERRSVYPVATCRSARYEARSDIDIRSLQTSSSARAVADPRRRCGNRGGAYFVKAERGRGVLPELQGAVCGVVWSRKLPPTSCQHRHWQLTNASNRRI